MIAEEGLVDAIDGVVGFAAGCGVVGEGHFFIEVPYVFFEFAGDFRPGDEGCKIELGVV